MQDKLRYLGALMLGAVEFTNDTIKWHYHHRPVKALLFVVGYPVTFSGYLLILHLDLRNQ